MISLGFLLFGGSFAFNFIAQGQLNLDISAVVPGPTPPSSGGGGSSGSSTGASARVSGYAFPNAKLTVLKDGAVATTLIANTDGSFQVLLTNLNPGPYQVSIYAEDPNGLLSSPHTFNFIAAPNSPYIISNIVIPPTISAAPTNIAIGSTYKVSGYAPAFSSVSIEIPTLPTLAAVTTDAAGYYEANLTAVLPPGMYGLRSKAVYNGYTSLYSKPIMVTLYRTGQQPIPPPPPQMAVCVDFNKDRRINLIDFSILLFWFNKQPVNPTIDCNQDKVIDIKDFSILMYFWTG